jgi:hypothetical protein
MPRKTKGDQAREAAERLAEMAWEAGFNHFHQDPEADMATVHRRASNIYRDSKEEALQYAYGYLAARLKHDDFLKERGSQS